MAVVCCAYVLCMMINDLYILQNVNDMQNEFKMKSEKDFKYVHKKLYIFQPREMNLCRVQLQKRMSVKFIYFFVFIFAQRREKMFVN